VYTITGPWVVKTLTDIMDYSASCHEHDTVKWCHEQGAEWPKSFYNLADAPWGNCWSLQCVQWAVANGFTRLERRCQDLAPQYYDCESDGTEQK
jgi:hypothetical protein